MNSSTSSSSPHPKSLAQGNLLGLLTAIFYILFTLLPDSNSLVVSWVWVFIWQIGLLCPVLWLLGMLWQRRASWLGNRLDWVVGLLLLGAIASTGMAAFPMQSRWYGWVLLCLLSALYALSSWLDTPQRRLWLLNAQGYLNLAFIGVSLALWSSQTFFPELSRLQALKAFGVSLAYDFGNIELRNWAPIGHQNYVAGYLVLALPLLMGLAVLQSGWRRWLWLVGAALGLVDLYTTSSRAGWLGVVVLVLAGFAILLWRSVLPSRWLWGGGAVGLTALVVLLLANNRLRSLVTGLSGGQVGGELAYRLITITIGWRMGLSHLFTGVGLGGVPLLYQQYRPAWAGREAELAYQLHSTPAQLWAELGLWFVMVAVGAIALLSYISFRWWHALSKPATHADSALQTPPLLLGCILSGLLAYGVVSLTDYQLDNLCISGTLVIFLAVLAATFREPSANAAAQASQSAKLAFPKLPAQSLPLAGLGIVVAATLWLVPIHRAWMLSSQGFAMLSRGDVNGFAERLEQAHQLAPWEPYYAHQLGWNLGDLGLQASGAQTSGAQTSGAQTIDPKQQQALIQDSLTWFDRGNAVSPNQEFGFTNLGWLLLNRDPKAAEQAFVRAAQLVPAKRGMFYGLGLALLAQGKTDLAVDAIALEAMRDPVLITSPIWQTAGFASLYKPVTSRMEAEYSTLLQTIPKAQAPDRQTLVAQLHQSRGALRWWLGDLKGAKADLEQFGTPLSQLVLALAEGKTALPQLKQLPTSGGTLAIAAWLEPAKRQDWLQKAWITANRDLPPPEILQQLVESMERSTSFDQWLKQNAPSRQYRRSRSGFGVLSRHVDGSIPKDYLTIVENIPITQFFEPLIPSFFYAPELDTVIQPKRDALLKQAIGS